MSTTKRRTLLLGNRQGLRLVLLALVAALTVGTLASPALAQQLDQETEQEGESGDATQSAKASQTGDNSNQCVGLQPVTNTGNAQTVVNIEQYLSRLDELELDDIGSSIEIDPTNETTCDQKVNQSAAASSENPGHCTWSWDDGWWCLWSTDGSWWFQDTYGTWTAYSTGLWYADYRGWWWLGYDGWWWTDGYYWWPYGWSVATTVSNVSAGTLDAARGTLPLVTLGALTLIGSASIMIRRNRRHGPEG